MKRTINLGLIAVFLLAPVSAAAKGDDFKLVVKTIEQFYNVKHKSLPFLAKAGLKTATTAARIAGGTPKRIAEAGSVRVAFFEDQEFNSRGNVAEFQRSLTASLTAAWTPFIQTISAKDEEQTYIFLRAAGEKWNVLVITIGKHEGVVVQVNVSQQTLAQLLKDPDELGKAITDDATTVDDQE